MTQLGRAHFGSSTTNRQQIHSIQLPYCGALPKFEEFMPRDAEEAQCRDKRTHAIDMPKLQNKKVSAMRMGSRTTEADQPKYDEAR